MSARTYWPLAAITLLAAVLRLATIDLQSLWYDEAYTPVHVLHSSLSATWTSYVHSENSPPLWYLLEWLITRALGTGAVALRLLSALAGIAAVPVAWAIGSELAGRRAAIAMAAFVATSPLLVWYSQEARAYGLFVLTASLALLCFVRVLGEPTTRRVWLFALAASLALLTHYFAIFLLIPMIAGVCLRLLANVDRGQWRQRVRKINPKKIPALIPLVLPVVVGAALIPLIVAQGGHGTQWIGEWALASRLEAIPQYYLTGYTGSALGHGVELLVALVILAGVIYGLWKTLTPREERGALIVLIVAAAGVLLPLALAVLGADYLAPRNLVAAMVPASALLAIVIVARRTGVIGMALAGVVAAGFLILTLDVDLSPRLQRGDWRGVAKVLREAPTRAGGAGRSTIPLRAPNGVSIVDRRAIVTVELGAAPLEYYLPPLRNLAQGARVRVSEVVETGYAPLRASAGTPPARGLRLSQRRNVHGLYVYRFISSAPVTISESQLRESAITRAPHPEVLVPVPSG
ncbi:MAG TPA: glycosyltransferase family 39 protein [Solirubrobacteraceae bacterium]|nr:glycosyltransferase family 39 protein [Solirubrobacteraceae bacterium]